MNAAIAELIEVGKDLDQRITRLQVSPADRVGERASIAADVVAFLDQWHDVKPLLSAQLVDTANAGVSLGQLQELLELVCRIGRAFNLGLI